MASKEESLNLLACRDVLRPFSLSNTETSVEQNLHNACTHHQWVAVEDAPEMAQVLDAKRSNIERIIEEVQAHGAQVAVLSQMQLQAMERVDVQKKEL